MSKRKSHLLSIFPKVFSTLHQSYWISFLSFIKWGRRQEKICAICKGLCFTMSQLFISGDQSIGALASVSALPMSNQGWFPLGLTGLISLLFKRLSRIFSRTTVQKHQFFGAWPSLWSNSHIGTWLLERL